MIRRVLEGVTDLAIHGIASVLLIRSEPAPRLVRNEQLRRRYCYNCGQAVPSGEIDAGQRCVRCGQYLQVCANCAFFDGFSCLLRRPEAADIYAGNRCPKFQFRETTPPNSPSH